MPLSPASQTLIENGTRLFAERTGLLSHWQELAEHFYYERADFTSKLSIGADYAANSFSSSAALYRREMGNLYRTFMRPDDFFEVSCVDERRGREPKARSFLQYATGLMRAVMYRRGGNFVRSTDVADHDHLTFGQCVLEVAPTTDRKALYYRAWHLRDVVWSEDYTGSVADIHRESEEYVTNLIAMFGDKVPASLRDDAARDKTTKAKVRQSVVLADGYDLDVKKRKDHRYVSYWCLPDHGEELQVIGRPFRGYVIPRAQTVSGSQYARSPFTSIVLPDARTKQAIDRILLEAGEKAVDPPLIAKEDVLRSDIGLFAGSVTYLDREYDERLGEALRPMSLDASGLSFGGNMADRMDMTLRAGLMLDKIALPDTKDLTAYQVRKIVEQQMRAQIPIFEPIETEYNEPLCAETFAVMRSLGAFPPDEIPESLRGADIEFSFKSPIKDLEDDGLASKLAEGMNIIQTGAQFDPSVASLPNGMEITKSMLRRLGWPEEWINSDEKVQSASEAMAQRQQQQEQAAAMSAVAQGAGQAAPMVKALSQ